MLEVVLVIAASCGIFIYFWLDQEHGRYTYGRNPAQRCCDDCGQEQWAYCHTLESWDDQWWEVIDELKNLKCKCHKDTK